MITPNAVIATIPVSDCLLTLEFTIPCKPVSVNQGYIRAGFSFARGAGGGKGLVLSSAAKEYKSIASAHALIAARKAGWPAPSRVKRVSLWLQAWNSRHDIDAPIKFTQDSLEGILYAKDTAVRELHVAEPGKDNGPPRVEVRVEMLD